jgi:tryptophan synthase alpha chain
MSKQSPGTSSGADVIRHAFELAHRAGQKAALMPYLTLGFPTPSASLAAIEAAAQAGADLFELGVPFSDPLADGPTIQHAAQVALEQGITVGKTIEMVRELRERGVHQPFVLMGYYNPFLQFGLERLMRTAAEAGVNGFIVPDLPYEEADEFEQLCSRHNLALVYLLAPTSSDERIREVASRSTAFIYLVSLTGVTGARTSLPANLSTFVERVRSLCSQSLPIAVGFGISTPEQAAQVGSLADGVIIGSAFIHAVSSETSTDRNGEKQPQSAAFRFITNLRHGLQAPINDASAAEAGLYAPHHLTPASQTRRMMDTLEENATDSSNAQEKGFLGC